MSGFCYIRGKVGFMAQLLVQLRHMSLQKFHMLRYFEIFKFHREFMPRFSFNRGR